MTSTRWADGKFRTGDPRKRRWHITFYKDRFCFLTDESPATKVIYDIRPPSRDEDKEDGIFEVLVRCRPPRMSLGVQIIPLDVKMMDLAHRDCLHNQSLHDLVTKIVGWFHQHDNYVDIVAMMQVLVAKPKGILSLCKPDTDWDVQWPLLQACMKKEKEWARIHKLFEDAADEGWTHGDGDGDSDSESEDDDDDDDDDDKYVLSFLYFVLFRSCLL
jgi:hypothetical protein